MRNKQKAVIVVFVLIILFNFMWFNGLATSNISVIEADKGVVNLSYKDLDDGIVELSGEWLYYDSLFVEDLVSANSEQDDNFELVNIPEYQKYQKDKNTKSFFRYGTYQLLIKGLEPDKAYGIYSREQVTSYQLYVNNKLNLFNGKVGRTKETSVPEWMPKNSVVYSDENGTLKLQMEISNFLYEDGLFWCSPYIGSPDQIYRYHVQQLIVDVSLNAVFGIIGLAFLLLFFQVKHERSVFYYAIFVLIMTVRMFFTASRAVMLFFPDISWEVVVRIEYLSGFLLLPSIIVFVAYLMNYSKAVHVRNACLGLATFTTIFVMMADHVTYTQFLNPYLYVALFSIIISIILIFLHYRKYVFYETILIISFVNFLIGLFQQLYGDTAAWVPIAVFNSVLGFSFILLDQFRIHIKEQEFLAINAAIDPLTSLYNRKFLINFSKSRFRDSLELNMSYVLFLDIDGFKHVNDIYGHDIGDEVMQIIGMRLKNCFSVTDYVFRYGGDEFVILMICDHIEHVKRKAKSVIKSINEPIVVGNTLHHVGISIGITPCDLDKRFDFEYYINASDKAMYSAKTSGGNRYEFDKQFG